MSIAPYLAVSTWRFLGLCVGTSYIGLGTTYAIAPTFSARTFGLISEQESPGSSATSTREELPATLVEPVMQLIAVRDVCFGIALLTFWNEGDNVAMGKVILSSMLICPVDWYVLNTLGRGPGLLTAIVVGGTSWLLTGLGLVGW